MGSSRSGIRQRGQIGTPAMSLRCRRLVLGTLASSKAWPIGCEPPLEDDASMCGIDVWQTRFGLSQESDPSSSRPSRTLSRMTSVHSRSRWPPSRRGRWKGLPCWTRSMRSGRFPRFGSMPTWPSPRWRRGYWDGFTWPSTGPRLCSSRRWRRLSQRSPTRSRFTCTKYSRLSEMIGKICVLQRFDSLGSSRQSCRRWSWHSDGRAITSMSLPQVGRGAKLSNLGSCSLRRGWRLERRWRFTRPGTGWHSSRRLRHRASPERCCWGVQAEWHSTTSSRTARTLLFGTSRARTTANSSRYGVAYGQWKLCGLGTS